MVVVWWWLVVAARCAGALPLGAQAIDPAHARPASRGHCDPLVLRGPSPRPKNVVEYEAAAIHAARALSEMVDRHEANEGSAAELARTVAKTPLSPPPAAVALGAPRLHIGVLFIADPPKLIIFQQNNTNHSKPFWQTLASAWNSSSVVWSTAWFSCDDVRSWWGGAAAARGAWPVRAAAALFHRIPWVPCEETMHELLGGPPLCDPDSTECEASPSPENGYRKLEYQCRCRSGYWRPGGADSWVFGSALEESDHVAFNCTPCHLGFHTGGCNMFTAVLISINIAGMIVCVIVGLLILKKRKCKAVALGMWVVLEVVIMGALLMYAAGVSQYISSQQLRCVAGAWLRELGFVACYGSVVLRLWVLLAEFRTRKAHRWTPRDAEVLRIVSAMLIGAACYLSAFTAMAICEEPDGCARAAWHHVTAAAELLLLVAGLRIAYAARNANVPFQERGWLSTALCLEAFSGVGWRLAAAAGAAPESSPTAATLRAHLSAGGALLCVLAPRLWYGYRARSLAQEVSRRGPAEGFGVEGEEEPTSEEVRAELKRLYVQLEILRNKTLRLDNPHISKRRGGRKPVHRRFSLQALQARRGCKGKSGGSTSAVEASEVGDASRTPEDSVCSNEGPSHYTDGETQA